MCQRVLDFKEEAFGRDHSLMLDMVDTRLDNLCKGLGRLDDSWISG